jgi:RNA polymerase sigma-70 factor (ECF subfamily)
MLKQIQRRILDYKESRLLEQLKSQDEALRRSAFDGLLSLHRESVQRFIGKYGLNYDDAGDVYAETTGKAYRLIHTFRGDCHFTTWLYTVARTCALDCINRKTGRPTAGIEDVALAAPAHQQPEQAVLNREIGHPALLALKQSLTEQDFLILYLREVEEMTQEEIAHQLGMSLKNVQMRFYRYINPATKKINEECSSFATVEGSNA